MVLGSAPYSHFGDDPHVEEDMARFEAAKRDGGVTHAAVRAWLLSKNTDNPVPKPKTGD